MLLLLVATFFERLHAVAGSASLGLPKELQLLLQGAFAAEVESSLPVLDVSRAIAISLLKSASQFRIMSEIALVRGGQDRFCKSDLIKRFVDALGCVFWLTDDLVDVVADERAGGLNTVLLTLRNRCPDANKLLRTGEVLGRLMAGSEIDEVIDKLCGHADTACALLERAAARDPRANRFRRSIINYQRLVRLNVAWSYGVYDRARRQVYLQPAGS